MAALERLTLAELRSINVQLEMLLREALARWGIAPGPDDTPADKA